MLFKGLEGLREVFDHEQLSQPSLISHPKVQTSFVSEVADLRRVFEEIVDVESNLAATSVDVSTELPLRPKSGASVEFSSVGSRAQVLIPKMAPQCGPLLTPIQSGRTCQAMYCSPASALTSKKNTSPYPYITPSRRT